MTAAVHKNVYVTEAALLSLVVDAVCCSGLYCDGGFCAAARPPSTPPGVLTPSMAVSIQLKFKCIPGVQRPSRLPLNSLAMRISLLSTPRRLQEHPLSSISCAAVQPDEISATVALALGQSIHEEHVIVNNMLVASGGTFANVTIIVPTSRLAVSDVQNEVAKQSFVNDVGNVMNMEVAIVGSAQTSQAPLPPPMTTLLSPPPPSGS